MPASLAESACLRCCRRCGGLLPGRVLANRQSYSPRPFHSTAGLYDDTEHNGHKDVRTQFRRRRERNASDEPQASKIVMKEFKFNLATNAAKSGPILMKNYERKKHGTKPEMMAPRSKPDSGDVKTLADEIQANVDYDAVYSQEEVNEDITKIRDVVLIMDSKRRLKDFRKPAGERREPRHNMPDDGVALKIITYATYDGVMKRLTRTYTQEQLSAYVQDFLSKADRTQYQGASDVSSIVLSGQGIHQGWRATAPERKRGDDTQDIAPWLRLPYGSTRSLKSVADRIVRFLWQFQVQEEISAPGTLSCNVDFAQAPFFEKPRHPQALAFIGDLPGVTLQISDRGDRITLTGSKYDCFDAERFLKNRIAEVIVRRFDARTISANVSRTKLVSGLIAETLPTLFGCIIHNLHNLREYSFNIIGPSEEAVDRCERAIVSALITPMPVEYSLNMTTGSDEGFLCMEPQASKEMHLESRHKSAYRFTTARDLTSEEHSTESTELDVGSLRTHLHSLDQKSPDEETSDIAHMSDGASATAWVPSVTTITDVGLVLHQAKSADTVRTASAKDFLKPRQIPQPFATTLSGISPMLSFIPQPDISYDRAVYVKLEGRPSPELGARRPPLLELEIRTDMNKSISVKARIIVKTFVKDIMLPHTSTDVRCSTTHNLELTDADQDSNIISFAEKVMVASNGIPRSSPWSLKLSIPSYTLGAAPRNEKKTNLAPTVEIDYFPVLLETRETRSLPFRGHQLEVTRTDGGPLGLSAEKVSLRMKTGRAEQTRDEDIVAAVSDADVDIEDDAGEGREQSVVSSDEDATVPSEPSAESASTSIPAEPSKPRPKPYADAVAYLVRGLNRNILNQNFRVAVRRSREEEAQVREKREERRRRQAEALESPEGAVPFVRDGHM